MRKESLPDYKETHEQIVWSPRVIIMSPGGDFPLVRYKKTDWYGLPGGGVQAKEYIFETNLLAEANLPTLAREVQEECGIDITPYLASSVCLGIAEVVRVDSTKGKIKHIISPIFLCLVPREALEGIKEGVKIVNLKSHFPGPLFPDARAAIEYLKQSLRTESGPILPTWLGPEKLCYFQMRPTMGLLHGLPVWR